MSQRLEVLYNKKPSYNIVIEANFSKLAEELSSLDSAERKVCIITDSIVAPLYLEEVTNLLQPICKTVVSYTFKAGEEQKNLNSVNDIYRFLIENHFDRKDMLLALGGGVVGDMTIR